MSVVSKWIFNLQRDTDSQAIANTKILRCVFCEFYKECEDHCCWCAVKVGESGKKWDETRWLWARARDHPYTPQSESLLCRMRWEDVGGLWTQQRVVWLVVQKDSCEYCVWNKGDYLGGMQWSNCSLIAIVRIVQVKCSGSLDHIDSDAGYERRGLDHSSNLEVKREEFAEIFSIWWEESQGWQWDFAWANWKVEFLFHDM